MLQQILRDMWVDPEILAELDEAQKQTLFCKMREEQVRRWQAWDQKVGREERPRRRGEKQVQFLQGGDGEPWVWVMGEHPDDKSINTILAEEARQHAVAQARQEAHQLRKSVEKELTQLIDYQPLDSLEQKFDISPKSIESLDESLEIYCTVDDLRTRIEALEPEVKLDSEKEDFCNENLKLEISKNSLHFNFIEGKRDVLQDIGITPKCEGVSHRVAAWERRVAAARAGDILRGMRARRARALRDAVKTASDDDAAWREQERKAKEAEANMREIARAAREAHRRAPAAPLAEPLAVPPQQAGKPSSREAVLEWYRGVERGRGGPRGSAALQHCFHGLITRSEAEQILWNQPPGSFLVRLSERVWGYAISYRAEGGGEAAHTRCKHFLVDTAAGYRLLPAGQRTHDTLADLISYHATSPLTESGGELLTAPCKPLKPVLL